MDEVSGKTIFPRIKKTIWGIIILWCALILATIPYVFLGYFLNYSFDAVGNGLCNTTSKASTKTASPQKSIGDNLNYDLKYKYDENHAHRLVGARIKIHFSY